MLRIFREYVCSSNRARTCKRCGEMIWTGDYYRGVVVLVTRGKVRVDFYHEFPPCDDLVPDYDEEDFDWEDDDVLLAA